MTKQSGEQGVGYQSAEPELRFNRRWRELVDRAGGQARVVNRLGWSKSTVSRDYRGEILPGDERLRQLCDFLGLSRPEYDEILRLLEEARLARQDRKAQPVMATDGSPVISASGLVSGDAWPGTASAGLAASGSPRRVSQSSPQTDGAAPRSRGRRKVAALIGAGVFAGIVLAVAALLLPGTARPAAVAAGAPVAQGTFPGMHIKAVAVAKTSLTPVLASAFGHGRTAAGSTVDGYVFRNMDGPTLCLTASSTGSEAGQDGDRVVVAACDGSASQIWLPEQWDTGGTRFTWLVNDRYQSKCLNARNSGGLHNGQRTMLWNCYQSLNEDWDFGDWLTSVKSHGHAYPIFVKSGRLCLDADKYDFRDGTYVNIWNQYPTVNQFWS
jgi:hypothetical protein